MITWQTKFICRWTFRFAVYFSIDIETYMLCNSGMDFSKNWICFSKLYFMFIIIIIKECFNLEIIDDKWSRPIEEIYLLFTKFLTSCFITHKRLINVTQLLCIKTQSLDGWNRSPLKFTGKCVVHNVKSKIYADRGISCVFLLISGHKIFVHFFVSCDKELFVSFQTSDIVKSHGIIL